jgi:hypothetical protein
MKIDRSLKLTLRFGHAGHMIDMAVCEENMFDVEVLRPHDLQESTYLIARIYDDRLSSLLAP